MVSGGMTLGHRHHMRYGTLGRLPKAPIASPVFRRSEDVRYQFDSGKRAGQFRCAEIEIFNPYMEEVLR
jgi:hypothetical protein